MTNNSTLEIEILKKNFDDFFLLVCATFISLVQPGFACLEAGAVHSKNATNIVMKNLLDTFMCAFSYYVIGYSLGYGPHGNAFSGIGWWAGYDMPQSLLAHWFFQFIFANTASTIISGAVAERCNFGAYLIYNTVVSGFIYPIVSHWAWDPTGWLFKFGYKDFAGSGVVHAVGGMCSLVAAPLLGPRIGRFNEDGKPNEMPAHSLPLVGIGLLLITTGFLAFNGGSLGHISSFQDGSIVARAMVSTILGGSGGAVMSLIIGKLGVYGVGPYPFFHTANGILAGMVSICAGADSYTSLGAMATGSIACLVYCGIHYLILWCKVDDPCDAIAVHLGSGVWGVLSVAIIGKDGIIFSFSKNSFAQFGKNIVGIIAITAWSGICSIIMFGILKLIGCLRVSEEVEIKGLDEMKHGGLSYPRNAYDWGFLRRSLSRKSTTRKVDDNGMTLSHRTSSTVQVDVEKTQF